MLTALILSLLSLAPDSIRVTGYCYNVADQTSLKCNMTLVFSTTKLKISADKSEKFAVQIPDSALYLIFESVGFETRTIGVNRIRSDHDNAAFAIKVPMLKNGMDPAIKEDEILFPKSQLFINVDAPDSVDLSVLLMDESKRNIQESRPIISSVENRFIAADYMLPGPYSLKIGLFEVGGKAVANEISREAVVLNGGFNFLSLKYETVETRGDIAILKPKTLYFDQSSYALRKDSKVLLDSVCAVLVRRHNLTARVTGHTDNVGRANLNLILSEYRARVVLTYMNNHGVRPGQIHISWKGSNAPVAMNNTEENKSRNRRVEIHLAQQAAMVDPEH